MEVASFDFEQIQASATKACRLLKVLSNADRLFILCELAQGERCVGEIEDRLGIMQPTLSQQLSVLREQAIVTTRREGKNIYYQIASPQALAVMQVLYREYCGKDKEIK